MMASINRLLFFGVFLAFSTVVIGPPPPGYELSENFGECQQTSDDLMEPMLNCLKTEFAPEQVNVTEGLHNSTACLQCKHLCRKQEQIKVCLSEGVQILKDVSNKSKTMVPFTAQLLETTIHALCNNEEEMFPAVTEEEVRCFRNSWETCGSKLEFVRYMEAVAFCDSGNPETDPLTEEYMCQKVAEYLDCTKESVEPCSDSLVTTFSTLITKLARSDSCARFN